MKITINDYAGHAFPIDLATAFKSRGHNVSYNYCSSNVTPQGDSTSAAKLGVEVLPIDLGRQFEKFRIRRRVLDELDYGIRSVMSLRRVRPEVALFGQLPVFSLLLCLLYCRVTKIDAVFWLQDLQAHLAAGQSKIAGSILGFFERLAVRLAPGIVTISEEMADEARSYGASGPVVVIENWARITEIVPKSNPWSKAIGADETFNFVYSGTLGAKHEPQALLRLAEIFAEDDKVRVIAVCAGAGRDAIEAGPDGVKPEFFDLVEPEVLPDVMGSADVLVVLLDKSAARAVVPSKILTYLAAARPILGLLPKENLAARIIQDRAEAGFVVDSVDDFLAKACEMYVQVDRERLSANGREYALTNFDTEVIAGRFEDVFAAVSNRVSS